MEDPSETLDRKQASQMRKPVINYARKKGEETGGRRDPGWNVQPYLSIREGSKEDQECEGGGKNNDKEENDQANVGLF